MAYADIGDKGSGDEFTEAMWDQIRANFQASAIDIVTTAGDLVYATAADALARLAIGAAGAELTPSSGVPGWQIRPSCRVYLGSSIDPATSTWTSVEFGSEAHDTNAMHEGVTNPERITIPANGDGVYHIGGYATFESNGASTGESNYGVRVQLNGATTLVIDGGGRPNRSMDQSLSCDTERDLNATDYVEFQVYTSGDFDVSAAAFWVTYLRPGA